LPLSTVSISINLINLLYKPTKNIIKLYRINWPGVPWIHLKLKIFLIFSLPNLICSFKKKQKNYVKLIDNIGERPNPKKLGICSATQLKNYVAKMKHFFPLERRIGFFFTFSTHNWSEGIMGSTEDPNKSWYQGSKDDA
jgi:hypothetical protein